jgi:hypothetical protein
MSQETPFFNQSRRWFFLWTAAGWVGYTNIARSQDAISTGKHFKSFVELNGDLALDGIGYHTAGKPSQSWPVPAYRRNKLSVAFMKYPHIQWVGEIQMQPPSQVRWLDPVTGECIAEDDVSPAYFGQTIAADEYLPRWSTVLPQGMTPDAYTNLKKHLFELYDTLFKAWATKLAPSAQGNLRGQAREFLKIFYQISEPPLKPYYEALGRDWFGWLRKLAG